MTAASENVDWAAVLPLARAASVVAVAGKLLALEKPAGIMTHPNRESDRNSSLLRAAYDLGRESYHWPSAGPDDPGELFLLNRIDSPTSGLVLAALDEETAAIGRRAFAEGRVEKVYFALVLGRPRPNTGVWVDRLARMAPGHPGGRGVRMGVGGSGPPQMAKSHFEVVESQTHAGALLSLVRLEPITGRTHQLRVQCATHGNPIVGDGTYGDFQFNREFARRTGHKRLFLHAAIARIPSLRFSAESPVPAEFYEAMGRESQ